MTVAGGRLARAFILAADRGVSTRPQGGRWGANLAP